MTSVGCSRASFPGGMAAVELENMVCILGCPFLPGGLTIKSMATIKNTILAILVGQSADLKK